MKNIPILTFLQRVWMLLVALVVTDCIAMTETHFRWLGKWVLDPEQGGIWVTQTPMEAFGPILWVLPFCIAIVLISLLVIHLYWRQTIDADTHSGRTLADWNYCTPFQRLLLATVVRIGIIIGLCVLCAGLARG